MKIDPALHPDATGAKLESVREELEDLRQSMMRIPPSFLNEDGLNHVLTRTYESLGDIAHRITWFLDISGHR